jgi:hypothetical protein
MQSFLPDLPYTCPNHSKNRKGKKFYVHDNPSLNLLPWNVMIDKNLTENIFKGYNYLNNVANPIFERLKKKIERLNIRSLLFEDEYIKLSCDIIDAQNQFYTFMKDIIDNQEFRSFSSSNPLEYHKIVRVLDLIDAINEMKKRMDNFNEIFNLQLNELISERAYKKREERCNNLNEQQCKNERNLYPCQWKSNFFTNDKCKYKYEYNK